jgi:hypothetical protein
LPKDSLLGMLGQQQQQQQQSVSEATGPAASGRFMCLSPHDIATLPKR